MSRKYTAQEMRELADRMFDYTKDAFGLEIYDCRTNSVDCDATHDVICMLRQAADMMEREKKWEYAVMWSDGPISLQSSFKDDVIEAVSDINSDGFPVCKAVKREIGEWEEVKDAQ